MATEDDETQTKSERLINVISTFPLSCDLIITFFCTSIFSTRFESRAVPFPPAFINAEGKKDVDSLRKLLRNIPPLDIVRKLLKYSCSFEYVDILDWLFTVIEPKSLELAETSHLTLPIDQHPNVVFGVKLSPNAERAWNRKKAQRNILTAFYGTNLENLYSIMKYGLDPSFSTVTAPLYGDGLYLTTQMSVSLLFSPFREGWRYSMIGEKLSILVLCEVIEDSTKMKRLRKQRSSLEDPLNSANILVKDKSFVRVKYFFIYTKNSPNQSIYSKEICVRVFLLVFSLFMFAWVYANKQIVIDIVATFLLK